ncbi:MAG: NAD(P)H-hydrate dehydratase [Ignavibacteria bacterium]|nr:NAD(P)H-hydrate dehydratase [Ignavibacteria bacterium]
MLPLLLPNEVRQLDQACRDVLGIAPVDLMEQAARSATNSLRSVIALRGISATRYLIACGGGNNGGDGLCMARMIMEDDPSVSVVVACDASRETMTEQTRVNMDRLPSAAKVVRFAEIDPATDFDVILDALIGVGGGADLREPIPSFCVLLNSLSGMKVAIDVPTGLDASTGAASHDVFRADVTITMETEKPGFFRNDGPACIGSVVVAPIGIPDGTATQFASTFRYEPRDIETLLPNRPRSASKFDNGRVLVIGGTRSMRGAPSLAAHAAISIGAGLVELAAPYIHPLTPREVMTNELPSHADGTIHVDAESVLKELLHRATVCAVGPGLGTNEATHQMMARCIDEFAAEKIIVLDADGLRLLSRISYRGPNLILTPHRGEFARLLGIDRGDLPYDIVAAAAEFAEENKCVLHVKDVPSITTSGGRHVLTVNGNPAMATAGSGDVLTGIVAGCAAQGMSTFEAASLGAYIHACAGDEANAVSVHQRMVAGDIIRYL